MHDKELMLEILRQIEVASTKIIIRFQSIQKISDFTDNQSGVDKLDAICMMFIVIGESLKKLDKITDGKLLPRFPEIDWKNAMKMRDVLSHHYADINASAVFKTCRDKIPKLHKTIEKIINLNSSL